MSDILKTLQGLLGGDAVSQISRQIGTDQQSTQSAMSAVLPTLLGAISRNASKPEGASALHDALARDHDGSALDNLQDVLGRLVYRLV